MQLLPQAPVQGIINPLIGFLTVSFFCQLVRIKRFAKTHLYFSWARPPASGGQSMVGAFDSHGNQWHPEMRGQHGCTRLERL